MKSETFAFIPDTTIAAIITPPGNSGVGIVRISGSQAYPIARKIINKNLIPRQATLTQIKFETMCDIALAIYFKAPHSFTGEDVVELQCHGGQLLMEKVLHATIDNGATLAQAGEFSRRAFMNEKMTLASAESVISIINAQSDAELESATKMRNGEFNNAIFEIEKDLTHIRAQIEVALDHPDEDIVTQNYSNPIRVLLEKIKTFTENIETNRYIFNGITVAILGKTNVGKSSIFNALLGSSRSIVTHIAGTTTDTVSESIQVDGYRIKFIDTAGLRETDSQIERMGIERSREALSQCDIALLVFEAGESLTKEDNDLLQLAKNKPHIIICNKSDIVSSKNIVPNSILVSAKTGENIAAIKKLIIEKTVGLSTKKQSGMVANMRQTAELISATKALESALVAKSLDCVASDVQVAAFHIANITGTNASESVLDEIFSRFCLGK